MSMEVSDTVDSSDKSCYFCSKEHFDSHQIADYGIGLIANELNNYIMCLQKEMIFDDGFMGQTLEKALKLSASSKVSQDDPTFQRTQKLAFSLLVSFPTNLFVWDIQKTMTYKCTEYTTTLEAAAVITKKTAYIAGFCILAKLSVAAENMEFNL